MISRRVKFVGSQGFELAAVLDLPGFGTPKAYALFAHCFTCTKDLKSIVNINRVLTDRGVVVLRFDFTGVGESGGNFADTGISSNVGDLLKAAEFLSRHYQPPKFLIGHSLGGTATLMAARRVPSCRAVATIGALASPADLRDMLIGRKEELARNGEAEILIEGRPFKMRKQFLDDLLNNDMQEEIRALGKALLVMHAPSDTMVGVEHGIRIFEAARQPKSFIALDGADHLLLKEDDARYAGGLVAAWMERYF